MLGKRNSKVYQLKKLINRWKIFKNSLNVLYNKRKMIVFMDKYFYLKILRVNGLNAYNSNIIVIFFLV